MFCSCTSPMPSTLCKRCTVCSTDDLGTTWSADPWVSSTGVNWRTLPAGNVKGGLAFLLLLERPTTAAALSRWALFGTLWIPSHPEPAATLSFPCGCRKPAVSELCICRCSSRRQDDTATQLPNTIPSAGKQANSCLSSIRRKQLELIKRQETNGRSCNCLFCWVLWTYQQHIAWQVPEPQYHPEKNPSGEHCAMASHIVATKYVTDAEEHLALTASFSFSSAPQACPETIEKTRQHHCGFFVSVNLSH